MAVENPPLNRLYVLGYAANDRDYPIVSMNLDPRVAGYKVPEDLSTCPDKRYPNHVFTGAQPLSGDERVRHVWEVLPSPWVPFTRYDDDLGPIQGRRRSVENTGQQASLVSDTKISYEGREGSAIVSTELEETWSIKTDEDGNSLFPIKDRDFYDASRGPVQERRQLFVPTGEEVGSLENVDGVITQTSYEPYNEFLSVKIVQTYKVDGPQLIGKTTDNDGQLVTVTTQRKGALNYIPPNPTATRTVEVNREDAESLVERIVDTPEIFKANTFSVERPDPIPQKFRVAVPIQSSQEIVEGDAEVPTLEEGEISKSEEQRNKFIKRVSSTSRDQAVLPQTLTGKTTNNERQEVTVTETLQLGNTSETPTATTTIESEALGDGNYVITKTQVGEVFGAETYRKIKEDLTPQKFKAKQEESTFEENVEGIASSNITLATGQFVKSEQQINKFVKRVSTTTRDTQNSEQLNERVITPEGQLASRTITLASGNQILTPSATVIDGNIEELGDGRTVKTEIKIDKVFDSKQKTITQATQIPAKFLNGEITETVEIEEGDVEEPEELGEGGFGVVQSSSQRVSEFVRRQTKKEQDGVTSLTENQTNNFKQKVTVTSSIVDDPEVQPSATTEFVRTQSIGGGKYVKETGTVDEIFESKSITESKPDTIPERFFADRETKLTSKNTIGEFDESESLNLSDGELRKTKEQVDSFVYRETSEIRDEQNLPTLDGIDYEESIDVQIPYKEFISDNPQISDSEITPLGNNKFLVRKYEKSEIDGYLSGFIQVFPSFISLNLPRILRGVEVTWDRATGASGTSSSPTTVGSPDSGGSDDVQKASNSESAIPNYNLEFEDISGSNLEATTTIFFTQDPSMGTILSKTNSVKWPIFKTKSQTIVGTGAKLTLTVQATSQSSVVRDQEDGSYDGYIVTGNSYDYDTSIINVSVNVPPCLCAGISGGNQETITVSAYATATAASSIARTSTINQSTQHTASSVFSIPATNPADIPRSGRYLVDASVDFFKYGYYIVRATTINASIFA